MIISKLDYYLQKLGEEENRIKSEITNLEEYGLSSSVGDTTSELSSYDNHPADLGSETFERGKDIAIRENLTILLAKINEAKDNIQKATYGVCEKCGRDIPADRLDAVPWTSECIDCQKKEERNYADFRPLEEKVSGPPFARTYLDQDSGQNGFDGEDSFQAVQRYGTSDTPQDLPGMIDYKVLVVDDPSPGIVDRTDEIPDYYRGGSKGSRQDKDNNRAR